MISQPSTIIYLICHAQSEADVAQMYGSETILTELGNQQIQNLTERVSYIHFDAVYSSDYIQARQTAQLLADQKGLPVQLHSQLRERYYGEFESLTEAEAKEKYVRLFAEKEKISIEHLMQWRGIPQAETKAQAGSRVQDAIVEISSLHTNQRIAIISHSEAISTFLVVSGILQLSQLSSGEIEHTGYFVLEYSEGTFQILESTGVTLG